MSYGHPRGIETKLSFSRLYLPGAELKATAGTHAQLSNPWPGSLLTFTTIVERAHSHLNTSGNAIWKGKKEDSGTDYRSELSLDGYIFSASY